MPVRVRICPTVREKDGLAMSSRNFYLSPKERAAALALITALRAAEALIKRGVERCDEVIDTMNSVYRQFPDAHPDYILCVDSTTYRPVEQIVPNTIIATAARVGTTHLIDNIVVSPPCSENVSFFRL